MSTTTETDYAKYRGKCKELSEAAVRDDPSLTLVRGHYLCWAWGEQAHWWTVRKDGTIYDPTAAQFPSKGKGEYMEFDGKINCAECGQSVLEADAYLYGSYAFCSGQCNGRFVGVY